MRILSAEQMRRVEFEALKYSQTFLRLMENAGNAAFEILIKHEGSVSNKKCVILCGKGNNGGDGFVVARKLMQVGANVTCVLAGDEPKSQEAQEMLRLLREEPVSILPMEENRAVVNRLLVEADIIVDALFGTGFKGGLSDSFGFLAEMSNLSKARIYSLDIPSGMDADTGAIDGKCFLAYCTIAFGCLKPAHLANTQNGCLGIVEVCDIGIPQEAYEAVACETFLIDHDMVLPCLKHRPESSYKGTFGRLLAVVGSFGMTGAAILATRAACLCGTGLVYLATPRSLLPALAAHLIEPVMLPMPESQEGCISAQAVPELLAALKKASACLVGCGLKSNGDIREIVSNIINNADCPIVLDADGINSITGDINIVKRAKHGIILTPHYGELSRLIGQPVEYVTENRIQAAQAFSKEYNVTMVLKGSSTVIAQPDGSIYLNNTENSGLAKGGSGDLLAGIIGGLLAQGYSTKEAAICGVYIHSQAAQITAARLCKTSMQPSDVLDDLYQLFKELD